MLACAIGILKTHEKTTSSRTLLLSVGEERHMTPVKIGNTDIKVQESGDQP